MNALINLKKNTWVCMFCGENYQSEILTDRADSCSQVPSCTCMKAWEYSCIQAKKEAKEFRSKYAKYIIKSGKVIKKSDKKEPTSTIEQYKDSYIGNLLVEIGEETNLVSKVNKMEKAIIYLCNNMYSPPTASA